MKENKTKTYFGRVLAFVLSISVMLCSFYGCREQSKTPDTSTSNESEYNVVPDFLEGDDDGSEESLTGEDDTEDGGSSGTSSDSDDTSGSKSTTKKTSSGKTTKSSQSGTTKKTTTTTKKETTTTSNTYYAPQVYTNSAPGISVQSSEDGLCVIDHSNTSSGYVMVKYSGPYSNIRIRMVTPDGTNIDTPFFTRNSFEAFPLTSGNGTYQIWFLGNNGGTSYTSLGKFSFNVALSYSTVAYIRPNIFVNYNSSTSCVTYAAQLTRGCDTDLAKVEAIYEYVIKNFKYDHAKASSVANAAYLPNLNSIWASKSGICYDYASMMTAMLRTQGIPTKLVVGYVSGQYHAWISTYIKGSGWINNIIYFNGTSWKLMDPTFAATGGSNVDYSTKYSYSTRYTY